MTMIEVLIIWATSWLSISFLMPHMPPHRRPETFGDYGCTIASSVASAWAGAWFAMRVLIPLASMLRTAAG